MDHAGGVARIRLHFSEPALDTAVWLKYDIINGWQDYAANAAFSPDRLSAELEIQDGGFGDADGVANGIIIDPSGFAIATGDTDGAADTRALVDRVHPPREAVGAVVSYLCWYSKRRPFACDRCPLVLRRCAYRRFRFIASSLGEETRHDKVGDGRDIIGFELRDGQVEGHVRNHGNQCRVIQACGP